MVCYNKFVILLVFGSHFICIFFATILIGCSVCWKGGGTTNIEDVSSGLKVIFYSIFKRTNFQVKGNVLENLMVTPPYWEIGRISGIFLTSFQLYLTGITLVSNV